MAFDVGGIPDLLASPDVGIVVPNGDQEALETSLDAALTRNWDRQLIADRAQSRTWQHVADEVIHQARQGFAEENAFRKLR